MMKGSGNMFQWIKGNSHTSVITLSDTCITLNNCAAGYFSDVRWCLIGLDYESRKLAVKPVSKRDYDLRIYPLDDLHKVSLGNGYARISNKQLMQNISELLNRPLNNLKLIAEYDQGQEMLIADLKQEIGG